MRMCIYGPHRARVNDWEKEFALSMVEWFEGVGGEGAEAGAGAGEGRGQGKSWRSWSQRPPQSPQMKNCMMGSGRKRNRQAGNDCGHKNPKFTYMGVIPEASQPLNTRK